MEARFRIEVSSIIGDPRSIVLRDKLARLGFHVQTIHCTDNYLIDADIAEEDARRVAAMLVQPVTQEYRLNGPTDPGEFAYALEIGYLPGVTDNVSHTVREMIEDLLKKRLDPEKSVFTSQTFFLGGGPDEDAVRRIADELHNPLIQHAAWLTAAVYRSRGGFGRAVPVVDLHERPDAGTVSLDVPEDELMAIAREGIRDGDGGGRRGPLALDMASMNAIREYFHGSERRDPTDVELESIAQTWSEHCKHTIFSAALDDDTPEGIYRAYIKEATVRIRREKGDRDFCVSVFQDNAGGIEFDDEYIVADKVETHNSPSALDPFGGSITGIVGVNRDAIGFGMASRPVANRYGYCFADPADERPLYRARDPESRMLPPRRIMEGVIHGVNVGGNTSGIPTPQGFVYFHERYRGKPLVFVGTVGLIPRTVNGRSSVVKKAMAGDVIVMAGGRVGRDGIHGATFSSEALSSGSPATAVQIGDPITQKKLSDAIVKEARDLGLFNSITDNGAGGLSCSVAEMARECGGFEVDLDRVPLKYPGLSPWQIWVSESQERMTLSVPEDRLAAFLDLMSRRGVEAAAIGHFNAGTRGVVRSHGKAVFDIDMEFLHEGLPRKSLKTNYVKPEARKPRLPSADDNALARDVVAMAGRLNTASFEFISSQYDHEVQAGSVIKPLQGPGRVNGAASVFRPVLSSNRGVALSQGLYPSYSELDPYRMAACAIDTAVRNAIAAGADPDRLAILDNFCWCDSNNPERLGQLKEAARACYDTAVAFGTPFISGKDSMFNDFRGYDDNFDEIVIRIPPTLLVSSIGIVGDVRLCQTLEFKAAGDLLYLVGRTADELGGSEYLAYLSEKDGSPAEGGEVPAVDAPAFLAAYRAIASSLADGLVASIIGLDRGGLAVALARSCIGGQLGACADLSSAARDLAPAAALFSESQGRLLVSVDPKKRGAFERAMKGTPLFEMGEVTETGRFEIRLDSGTIVDATIDALAESYRARFRGF